MLTYSLRYSQNLDPADPKLDKMGGIWGDIPIAK